MRRALIGHAHPLYCHSCPHPARSSSRLQAECRGAHHRPVHPAHRRRTITRPVVAAHRGGEFLREQTGGGPRARRGVLVRPGRAAGKHRELSGRGAGADRSGRAAAHERRARPGGVLSCRWQPPRARSSRATTAGCACSTNVAASRRPWSRTTCSARRCSSSTTPWRRASSAIGSISTRSEIRAAAEATTRSGKLTYIGQYQVGPLLYLRVNFTTGDAAGQNMTAKATLAACEWIAGQLSGPCRVPVDRRDRHRQEALAHQHAADPRQARRRRGRDQERRAPAADGRRHPGGVRLPASSHGRRIPGRLAPPTARTLPTASPRSSSPPARTSPTSRSHTLRSRIRGCSTTATTTGRSRCPASSWAPTAAAPACPHSVSASSCSAATARARRASSPRSAPATVLAGEISLTSRCSPGSG